MHARCAELEKRRRQLKCCPAAIAARSELFPALPTEVGILFLQFAAFSTLDHDDLVRRAPAASKVRLVERIFDHSAGHATIRF